MKNVEKTKIKETDHSDPMFMITGIEKGYSEREFLDELIRLNSEIVEELQIQIEDKIKVVAKKQCRNPSKQNWLLQAPPDITKWFLKRKRVYFDLLTVHVQEHINLAQCFRCAGFNHVAKYCTQEECCHKCGGKHKPDQCSEDKAKCPNCVKMKYVETNHSARDYDCPVYQQKLKHFRNTINYYPDF